MCKTYIHIKFLSRVQYVFRYVAFFLIIDLLLRILSLLDKFPERRYNGIKHTRVRDLFSLRIDPAAAVPIAEPAEKLAFFPAFGNDSINREALTDSYKSDPASLCVPGQSLDKSRSIRYLGFKSTNS